MAGAMVASLITLAPSSPVSAAPCDVPVVNAIACENTLPGNPETQWGISGAGDSSIQGFSTEMSVDQGQAIGFKVDTAASSYRLDIYRMGYYGGNGARLVATVTPTTLLNQPACLSQPSTGLVDCGNWTQNASWSVPSNAVSGIYFAKLVRTDGPSGSSHIYFVVRDDDGGSDLLMQTADTTWQAYNQYGGNSLYTGSPAGRAYKASYNRPLTIRDYAPEDSVFNAEYPMVRFLESNGYDVSYTSGIDTDRRGAELLEHNVFLSVGHDEYWSATQRTNVEAARAAGVHLAFFSGNEVFWKTRWENSIDASGASYRTLVSYKETKANAVIDPAAPIWTGTWRDPRFSPPGDGGRPENALTGQIFTVNCCEIDMVLGADAGNMRFWRNTRVASLTGNQTTTVGSGIIGYEWDEDLDNGFRPAGLFRVSETSANNLVVLQDYGSQYAAGSATHSMTMYRHASGALVFGAGTVQWSWGLDNNHDRGGSSTADPAAQQATINLFADMGVQPSTLMSGLVQASQSADTSAPTSAITFPQNGAASPSNSPITVAGTAAEVGGGRVGGIEVSTDNGATWRRAVGRANWTYTFTPTVNGPVTIRSRATDDSANIETPSAGITINVGGAAVCPCSIWSPADVPDRTDPDTSAVEIGVRFQAAQDGVVSGIRFYKSATNTGTHIGSLWTSTGTKLGSVTFTGESSSGWQQAAFATPIDVVAGQTYVASYFAPNAQYSVSSNYFGSAVTNGPLTALASSNGGNGVYRYTSTPSAFPNSTYQSENYWVDVVFQSGPPAADTTAPTVTSRVPVAGAVGVEVGPNLSATFSEPVTASTVQASVAAGAAAVSVATSYDAGTRTVTIDPTASLAYSTVYTVSVSGAADAAGNVMAPTSWTFTTGAAPAPSNCPCSIWAPSAAPSRTDSDTNAVEIGVKFRASEAGTVTGIRFYKSATNTGTHIGSLWTSAGTKLGSVTFTGESSSGWQQAVFATPINVVAGQTYVASYFAPNGRYSVTSNGFASSGVTRGPLTALQTGVDGGNGVYRYTSTASAFPNNTYQAENYWVDVVFQTNSPPADTTPPTVTARTPAAGAVSVSTGTTVTASFSEPVVQSSIQISVAPTNGTPVAAGTTYNAGTNTVTLTPTAVLAAGTGYTVTLSGAADPSGNVVAPTTWTFTTAAADATPPTVVTVTPVNSATGVASTTNISATFSEPVVQSSIQISVAPTNGTPVAAGTTYNAGTNTVTLTPTAALAAGTGYTVTVSGAADPTGNVMATFTSTFTTASADTTAPTVVTVSPVNSATGVSLTSNVSATFSEPVVQSSIQVAVAPTNGSPIVGTTSYNSTSRTFTFNPAATLTGSTGYTVTVSGAADPAGNVMATFTSTFTTASSDTTAPTVISRVPVAGAVGVEVGPNLSATFSEPVTASTVQASVAAGAAAVSVATSYDAGTRTVTIDPTASLAYSTVYTVSVSGAADAAGNVMAPTSWTFTTRAAPSTCPCSIWAPSAVPSRTDADTNAVEIGVKFRASEAGTVTGIRFYKSAVNTGTHIGSLWTSSGTKLGSVTFTGESSSGWQQAVFATPIDVVAGQTYVASYFAPNGRYSVTSNAFASSGVTRGPLTALQTGVDGGNGVYRYTSTASAFPNNTYQSENYWVDVVFATGPPPADTTSPTVTARTPAAGAVSVSTGTTVTASFSEPVNSSSIQISVAPTNGTPVAAGTTYNAGTNTVTLTPTAVLAAGTGYTVTLSGAADPSGNVVAPTTWTFTTAAADATPPTVVTVTPVNSATGVAPTTNVSATFDEPVVASSIQISVRPTSGSALAGTTSYNATSRTVTFAPTAALAGSTGYTVTVSGAADPAGNVMATFTSTFTTAAPSGCPCTIWPASTVPAQSSAADSSAVELGVKFRTSQAGTITGIRFYKGSANTGTHVGKLWTSSGVNLGTVTFTNESSFGWQVASFATPINVAADTTYVASYFAPNGGYALASGGLATGVTNGVLTALGSGVDGGNGVYLYGNGGFPNNTYNASNYFVDVVYNTSGADTTAPTVTSRVPAAGATNVGISTTVTATFSESINPATPQITITPTGGSAVAASSSYDAVSRTLTVVPTNPLSQATQYTVALSGAQDASGNTMTPISWTFTTASSSNCPCSIWPTTTVPATPSANDPSAVEVGVKFQSSQAGFITGVRFYKGTGNSGTHVGTLWSNTGTALAAVTFANESPSGWQEALFSGPVAIQAGTTYVVSYHAPNGGYALQGGAFGSAVTNGVLTAPASGSAGGNGVYAYGGGGFPSNSFNASNYFVDVVFVEAATDTTAPTLVSRVPAAGSTNASVAAPIEATFSEAVVATTVNMTVVGPAASTVTGVLTYNSGSRTASFAPSQALGFSTLYTVTVSGAKDLAGNTMATNSWTFTTAAPPPPLPTDGPGGPIGVATSGADPFSAYFAEILRAEGLNQFATFDVANLNAAELAKYDTVVLGRVTVSTQQVNELTTWVQAGGNLIASRPDPKLASLLGLSPVASSLSEGYIQVNGATEAGAGIETATMQYHGTADRYTLAGASAIATLFSNATTSATNPAVTIRSVGTNGGQAAAFTYDLARSVVYTRQGNPAWSGQERDNADGIIRTNDLYFGGASADYVNLDKVAIPQADEQQRLFANLIQVVNRDVKPLPRFWYFPDNHKAVVVATGDDHATGGTAGRFNTYLAADTAGCSTVDWECNRFGSYIYTNSPMSNSAAAAYNAQDFEIGLHPNNGCRNFTSTADLRSTYANELATWTQNFPSLPSPVSNRFHCLVWSDWESQFVVQAENGIRFDVNYYYWPGAWVNNRPGFMTGSGMPQRFAKADGTMIDIYQAATQMTDESGQSYPFTPDTLLDKALGSEGYYGYFVANMHTDLPTTQQDTALVSSATSRGVPIVSSRDVLEFVDARNQSSFQNIAWTGNQLGFGINAAPAANNLTAMVPTAGPNGLVLSGMQRGASSVSYTLETIKGLEYASFDALAGSYTVTYAAPAAPASFQAGARAAMTSDSASVTFSTDVPAAARVEYGTSPDALDSEVVQGGAAGDHEVVIDGLDANETYFYRVVAEGPDGTESVWPNATESPATFQTAPIDRVAPQISGLSVAAQSDGTAVVSWITDELSDSVVAFENSLGDSVEFYGEVSTTRHEVVLTGLEPGQAYELDVSSTDPSGNRSTGSRGQIDFVAATAGVSEYMAASQRVGQVTRGAQIVDVADGLGVVTMRRDAAADGSFDSRILDARQMVSWTAVEFEADVPENAKMVIRVRGGQSPEVDATWGEWSEVESGDALDIESRFIQYRVEFQTGPGALQLPRLMSISFSHDAGFAVVDQEFRS